MALARGVLGGEAERVPAHGVQHGIAARPPVAGHHVAQGVVADVPHVDFAAGVGEHLQHVVFRLAVGGHVIDAETPPLGPGALPARLGLVEVVAWCVGRTCHSLVHAACIVRRALWCKGTDVGPKGSSPWVMVPGEAGSWRGSGRPGAIWSRPRASRYGPLRNQGTGEASPPDRSLHGDVSSWHRIAPSIRFRQSCGEARERPRRGRQGQGRRRPPAIQRVCGRRSHPRRREARSTRHRSKTYSWRTFAVAATGRRDDLSWTQISLEIVT